MAVEAEAGPFPSMFIADTVTEIPVDGGHNEEAKMSKV